jgi:hypothetical protein
MKRFLSSLVYAVGACALIVACSASNASSSGDSGTDAPLVCGAKGQACCQADNCNLGLTCSVGTCVTPRKGDAAIVSPTPDAAPGTDSGMPGTGHEAGLDAAHDSGTGVDANKNDATTDAKTMDAKKDVAPPIDSGKDAGVDAKMEASAPQDAAAEASVDGS